MSAVNVAIVDSGGANIASLVNAVDRLDIANTLTHDEQVIQNASHVILPGVGSAANSMQRLIDYRLTSVITSLKQPVLGICLGMQLFARYSAERNTECLGIVPADVESLQVTPQTPVPNMGWCRTKMTDTHEMFSGIENNSYFYFVHGYALPIGDYTIATANHSNDFTAVLAHKNFFATQFHPERSAGSGARLLRNFFGMAT